MSITNYFIDQVIVSFGPIDINGYANDTFVEIEREEDGWTTYVGALGDVCRTQNLNRSGKITLTLMATAPVNDLLAAIAQEDEDFGIDYHPMSVKDLSGNMRASGEDAWIVKRPKIERGKESGTVQWVFMVAKLNLFEGGNL